MNRPQFTLYRGAAVADATSPGLQKDMSVLVADNRILAIRPTPDEGILPPGVHIIDAGGSTIVPGMVDAHSHVTLPGGSHWIDRGFDPPEELLRVAEHNGDLLSRAGVRWARDVGSPAAAVGSEEYQQFWDSEYFGCENRPHEESESRRTP